MKIVGWICWGLGAVAISIAGCGGGVDSHPDGDKGKLGSARQSLAFVPPINGGTLLVAGNGTKGFTDSADPRTGTLNDPAGVLALRGSTYPSDTYLLVADWGNNAIRIVTQSGAGRGIANFGGWGGPNLLVNSRAELEGGPGIPGWTIAVSGGNWTATSSTCPGCSDPWDGNRMFYAGDTVTSARLLQDVDVSGFYSEIDAGRQKFCFSGLMRSFDEPNPDSTRVTIQSFNNTSSTPLGTVDSDEHFYTGGWIPLELEVVAPEHTRRLRVNLLPKRYGCATCSNDGYYDGLQLRTGGCQTPSVPFVDRPQALAQTLPHTAQQDSAWFLVGAKGLCYATDSGGYVCPPSYDGLYVEALALGTGRVYVASAWRGLGYVSLNSLGVPTGPFTPLVGDGNVAIGRVRGLAVEAQGANERVYVTSRAPWRTVTVYDCTPPPPEMPEQCTKFYQYSGTPGFRDAVSGAIQGESFQGPSGLSLVRAGDLLVADTGNHAIRRVSYPFVTTVGGTGTPGNSGNGGPSVTSTFREPSGVSVSATGDIYVADRGNNQIRKIVCASNDICAQTQRFNASTGACDTSAGYDKDDGNPCTGDGCFNVAIKHYEASNGSPCSDGNACNGNETCQNVVCTPGTPVVVPDDGNSCTADFCDPTLGIVHKPVAANTPCTTGSACLTPGKCNASATCVAGGTVSIDDLNPCTADACGATGVTHTPLATGTSCGTGKQCDATGACVPTNVSSLNPGTVDRTLPAPPGQHLDELLAGNGGSQTGCCRAWVSVEI